MTSRLVVCLLVLGLSGSPATADVTTETVAEGLARPSAVAIQPETGHPFVVERGSDKVVRVVDGQRQEVVTGFEGAEPRGLEFIDKNRLVVVGEDARGEGALVQLFKLPDELETPLSADEAAEDLTDASTDEESEEEQPDDEEADAAEEAPPAPRFELVATDQDLVYAAGENSGGQIWRKQIQLVESNDEQPSAARRGGRRGEAAARRAAAEERAKRQLRPLVQAKDPEEAAKVTALIVSPRREITAGEQVGDDPATRLAFYDPSSGSSLLRLDTGLANVVALAYSPETGRLYALAKGSRDDHAPGLYRLDAVRRDGRQTISPQPVLDLEAGIAMTFSATGELFLLVDPEEEDASGQLLKIATGL